MIIAGIDPGKTGAMVTLFEDGSTIVARVPLLSKPSVSRGKKTVKMRPDWVAWARTWRQQIDFNSPDVFMMEQVEARPGQGVTSMFSFGKATGFAMACIMYAGVPIHYARPNVWKDKMGLAGFDKSASVDLALRLVPSLAIELQARRGNPADVRHGIAEAGLLAYYGMMTIRAEV